MTIALQSIEVRHERRIRLFFTGSLASGAFGAPGPAYYVLSNTDGLGPSPTVLAAYLIPDSPTAVELALSVPLVKSALYTVSAVGVPSTDLSVTPAGSVLPLRWGLVIPKTNVEPIQINRQRLLYGVDLLWNGEDFQENALNDLERVEGTANVTKALNRGIEANGLPWDQTYGARAREFVDSPSAAAGTLKGSVTAQLQRDPRVKTVKTIYEIDDEKTYLYADVALLSGEQLDRVSIVVPNDS